MKVIFLDIDGVLQPYDSHKRFEVKHDEYIKKLSEEFKIDYSKYNSYDVLASYLDWDIEAVSKIKKIILETNSKIVISSSWRSYIDHEGRLINGGIKDFLHFYDLDKYYYDETGYIKCGMANTRIEEIQEYLEEHPEIDNYVVIDDMDLSCGFEGHFVKTSNLINDLDMNKCISILNSNTLIKDFKCLKETNNLFIDKTLFIKELIDEPSPALMFLRPKGFGKTINLSMLNYYFNIKYDSMNLFKNLNIGKLGDKYLKEMNKYPVIYLSFKDCLNNSFLDFKINFQEIISNLYKEYLFILDSPNIDEYYKNKFKKWLNCDNEFCCLYFAIYDLMDLLKTYYNKQVIVLIDDYDVLFIESYLHGYYKEMLSFIDNFFISTFKDNNILKKGIIIGNIKVCWEGIFSSANNIIVYSVLDSKYSSYFGFLESEVKDLLNKNNLTNKLDYIKTLYGGYNFSNTITYNPRSIIVFLTNDITWENIYRVDFLKNLIYRIKDSSNLLNEYHELLETGKISNIRLEYNIDLNSLKGNSDTVLTLLMDFGYLTPFDYNPSLKYNSLKIPNLEIKKNLENICISWFNNNIERDEVKYLIKSLKTNNLDNFKYSLKCIINRSLTYYNLKDYDKGENFYHAFVMGLLYSGSNNFDIISNRESGYGRYDLILKPKNNSSRYAYVIEFKAIEENNFDNTLEKAFKQIDEKNYIESIKEYDVTKIVIIFKGKEIRIETRK